MWAVSDPFLLEITTKGFETILNQIVVIESKVSIANQRG